MNYRNIIKEIKEMERLNLPSYKVGILSNVTMDPIIPFIKYNLFKSGFKPDVFMADFDNVFQNVLEKNSDLYLHNPDVIIVAMNLRKLSDKLFFKSYNEDIYKIEEMMNEILSGIRINSKASILLHNFEIPIYTGLGVLEGQRVDAKINIIRSINQNLIALCQKYSNVYIIDIDRLQSLCGYENFINLAQWYIGKVPYSVRANQLIANEYIKLINSLRGLNKKCLVLDCDNTLWGGIIGEDGINGIKLGNTYPGQVYKDFQCAIMELYERGIILAICSKNNEDDVMRVLEDHPDMILRKNYFSVIKANWNDKIANLNDIAKELNIGLDSLVMVDDSEFEIHAINKLSPEIKTILLPTKNCVIYSDVLFSSGFFDSVCCSVEDKNRGQMYKAQLARKQVEAEFTNLEDYLKFLEMEIFIKKIDDFAISRVSQLTQKTNQFNFTTKRYSELEIKNMMASCNFELIYVSVKDRFGDSGITGVAIVEFNNDLAKIDSFLLSCRIIGRGIEKPLLKACFDLARNKRHIIGLYAPTQKNKQAESFFLNEGFEFLKEEGGTYSYIANTNNIVEIPKYFKKVNTI